MSKLGYDFVPSTCFNIFGACKAPTFLNKVGLEKTRKFDKVFTFLGAVIFVMVVE